MKLRCGCMPGPESKAPDNRVAPFPGSPLSRAMEARRHGRLLLRWTRKIGQVAK